MDALIEQLAEADSADEIAQIREQLQASRAELAAARAELAGLKQRADFSTAQPSRWSATATRDGWSIGDAADDAGSVLEDLAGATLVALAVLVPLGAWSPPRSGSAVDARCRRRSRERALDD